MNRYLLTLVSLFIAVNSFSQITLKSADFPKSGKIYDRSTATAFQGMDETLTGPGYAWDYSLLSTTKNGTQSDTFITVSQTASLYSLVFLLNSNHAIHGTDFSIGSTLTVTNAFNFFNNSSSSYVQTGFGANISAIPTPVKYNPVDRVYKFPLNYGNVDSSNSAYTISIPTLFTYHVDMTRLNEVDGWGTLTLPGGSYDVLRLKSTIVEVDSIFVDTLLNLGFTLPPITRYEYKWLGAGRGEPLLQINASNGFVTSITYFDTVSTIGIAANNESLIPELNVYPNPATDIVTVRCNLPVASDVSIDIVDLTGRVITSSEMKHEAPGDYFFMLELPQSLPASSNYFVKMNWNGKQVLKPLTIVK